MLHLSGVEVSNRQDVDGIRDIVHRIDHVEVEALELRQGAHDPQQDAGTDVPVPQVIIWQVAQPLDGAAQGPPWRVDRL